jgi:hypothetical protein
MSQRANNHGREGGSGLIVIIMIVAFMLAVGMLLLTVTSTSPKAADSMRLQGMAFDAAEAGFNAAWVILNDNFLNKVSSSFNAQYRVNFGGVPGLDDPTSPNYFRSLTDDQLVADIAADNTVANPALFSSEPLAGDPRCAFTVFLINDEAPGTITVDDRDCILVCIGRGPRNTFKRLEIVIEVGS